MIEDLVKKNMRVMFYFRDDQERDKFFTMVQSEVDVNGIDPNDSASITDVSKSIAEELKIYYEDKKD